MKAINLNRSPFKQAAVEFVRKNPGVCKRQVILGVPHRRSRAGGIAAETYSDRNEALLRLVEAGYLADRGGGNRSKLYAVCLHCGQPLDPEDALGQSCEDELGRQFCCSDCLLDYRA